MSENIKEERLTGWGEQQSINGSTFFNNSGESSIHILETKRHSKPIQRVQQIYSHIKNDSLYMEPPSFSNPNDVQEGESPIKISTSEKRRRRYYRPKSLALARSTQRLYNDQVINHQVQMKKLQQQNEQKLSETMNCSHFLNRKSVEILKTKEISPLQHRYKQILEDRQIKREQLRTVMTFERLMKDPENINPTFQPNATVHSKKRKLSRSQVDAFVMNNELWQQRKQQKLEEKREKNLNKFDFQPQISQRSQQLFDEFVNRRFQEELLQTQDIKSQKLTPSGSATGLYNIHSRYHDNCSQNNSSRNSITPPQREIINKKMKKVKSTGGLYYKPQNIAVKRIANNNLSFGANSKKHSRKSSIFNLSIINQDDQIKKKASDFVNQLTQNIFEQVSRGQDCGGNTTTEDLSQILNSSVQILDLFEASTPLNNSSKKSKSKKLGSMLKSGVASSSFLKSSNVSSTR